MTARPVPTLVGAVACLLCATALTPLFEGLWWWFVPVAVATAVGAGVGMLVRLLRLPLFGQAALGLLGLLVTVTTLSDARADALFGVVPTPAALRTLKDLIVGGSDDIARLAAPVPQRPGLVVLTVVGVYLVVLIVDVLVVALGRPALAGLPLLGLFAVPAAVLEGGVGIVPFLLGAVGFLLLLVVDGQDTAGRWGRPVNGHRAAAVRSGSAALGARVAASTIAVAVALTLLVPTLDNHGLLGRGLNASGSSDGPSTANVLQPIAALRQQLQNQTRVELMHVKSTDAPYLRLTALDLFDGTMFTLREIRVESNSSLPRGLPDRPTGVPTRQINADITVLPNYQQHLLPVPGMPTSIDGLPGTWRWDNDTATIFSTENTTAGAQYHVEASVPDPSADFLAQDNFTGTPPDDVKVDTDLPADLDVRIGDLVTQLTADKPNTYQRVLAIENYLRGPLFTYDLNGAPDDAATALQTFLFDTRTGYCEQFASAMVVMVRKLGVPARVAIGFTGGTQDPDTGIWTVTNKDAHAWPEVWFPKSGWVRFEPTQRDDGATLLPPYSSPAGGTEQSPGTVSVPTDPVVTPVPVPVPTDQATASPSPTPSPTAATTPADANDRSRLAAYAIWVGTGLAVMVVIALLAAPAVVRASVRRRRVAATRSRSAGVVSVHEAWSELIDIALDLGVPLSPAESPRAGAARLGNYLDAGPEADEPRVRAGRDALNRLAAVEEHARYAPPGLALHDTAAGRVAEDLAVASKTLWAVSPRGQRLRAALAPPSVLSRLSAAATSHSLAFRLRARGPQADPTAGEYGDDRENREPTTVGASTSGHLDFEEDL